MKLQGKKALVTGASAGIGRAIAWAYAQEGADVAIHYNSSSEAAEELRQEMVQSFGTKAICIRADLGSDEDEPGEGSGLFLGQVFTPHLTPS